MKYITISKCYDSGEFEIEYKKVSTSYKKREMISDKGVDIWEDMFYSLKDARAYIKECKESM